MKKISFVILTTLFAVFTALSLSACLFDKPQGGGGSVQPTKIEVTLPYVDNFTYEYITEEEYSPNKEIQNAVSVNTAFGYDQKVFVKIDFTLSKDALTNGYESFTLKLDIPVEFEFLIASANTSGTSETEHTFKYYPDQNDKQCSFVVRIDLNKSYVDGNITLNYSYNDEPFSQIEQKLPLNNKDALTYRYLSELDSYAVSCKDTFSVSNVTLPSTYNGKPIKKVDGFSGCTFLKNIVLPSTVTSIGKNAFKDCTSLTGITVPNSVTNIGYQAFCGCSSFKNLVLPSRDISIDSSAFSGCPIENATLPTGVLSFIKKSDLKTVTINGGTEIEDYAFYNCDSLKSVSSPFGVTKIGEKAFYGCNFLESVTLGSATRIIGDYAFSGCNNLTNAELYSGITEIGEGAFLDCSSLTNITIPDTVTSVGAYAFNRCSSLTNITLYDKVDFVGAFAFDCGSDELQYNTYDNGLYLGNFKNPYVVLVKASSKYITSCTINPYCKIICQAFENCDSLANIVIPNNVIEIGDFAFCDCSSLKDITLPNGVKYIGDSAFGYCNSFTKIVMPDSVTYLGSSAFGSCTRLTSITLSNNLTHIGAGAFSGCNSLEYKYDAVGSLHLSSKTNAYFALVQVGSTSITEYYVDYNCKIICNEAFIGCKRLGRISLPNGLIEIGDYAFYECNSLVSLVLPNSLKSIGDYAFYECNSLESLVLPNSVTYIGEGAFNCYFLNNVVLPNAITSISNKTFYHCGSLTNITIPDSVKIIGEDAFNYCTSLESVTAKGLKIIEKNAFRGCKNLTDITALKKVVSIGDYAFAGTSLTNITLDSVTEIGEGAFSGCTSLTSITLSSNLTSIGKSAFSYCTALTRINYNGTKEQWENISKGSYWNDKVPASCKVHCVDGDVSI